MRVMAVICATDEKNVGLERSRTTLEKHGIQVFLYGLGEPWQGNGMKQVAAQIAAEKFQGQCDFILSLDGYDTLCFADEDEIVEKFMAFRHPMVIAAEMNCWPDVQNACRYPRSRTSSPFRFLNGGAYMAQTDYLVAMLREWGITKDFQAGSDQGFLTDKFLTYPGSMMIDEECSLFQTLCGVKPEHFYRSGKRVIHKKTYQVPCVLHGNGHMDMDWYWGITQ